MVCSGRRGGSTYRKVTTTPRAAFSVLLLAACMLCMPAVVRSAESECTVVTRPSAIDIRSRPTYIAIIAQDLRDAAPEPSALTDIRSTMTSTTGRLQLSTVSTYTAEQPYELGLTFLQLPTYTIFTNDTLTARLPKSLFTFTDGCTVVFPVTPSAGTIATDGLTTTFFEVQVNAANIVVDLSVAFDEFQSGVQPTVTPTPLPYGLQMVIARFNATLLRVTLLQNATLNIPSTSGSSTIRLQFLQSMMRTGISPEVGTLKTDYLQFVLNPSVPSVRVSYPLAYGGGAIPSELLWDGTAEVVFQLLGDVWLPNASLWEDPATQPTFVAVPFQSSGFDLLRNCSTLRVAIVGRNATVSWGSCYGFAVTSIQSVGVSDWGQLSFEGSGDVDFGFQIRPATAASISVHFQGPSSTDACVNASNATCTNASMPQPGIFANNVSAFGALTEYDVRRYGLNVTLQLVHDIFSPTIDASVLEDAFDGNDGMSLSLGSLQFTLHNTTTLTLRIPPQLSYNIDAAQTILVSVAPSLIGSRGVLVNHKMALTVRAIPTPICEYPSGAIISAAMVRSNANTSFDILVINDTVCNLASVATSIVPLVSSTRGLLSVNVNTSYVNASRIRFVIPRLSTYAISAPDFVTIPMTAAPFCSLEACQVPSNPNNPTAVLFGVRPSAGALQVRFPTVNETYLRDVNLVATVVLAGDIFTQSSFFPSFTVTGSTLDTARGFVASIQKSCVMDVDGTNASIATLSCRANASYDVSATETIRLVIARTVVSSSETPDSTTFTTPLVVTPLQGTIVANISHITSLNESTIIAGGYTVNFTLQYERWNVTSAIAAAIRANYPPSTTTDSAYSTATYLSTFLPQTSFSVVGSGHTLLVVFARLSDYDILTREVFPLLFDATCVLSGIKPKNDNYTFVVTASRGYITASGSALLFGVRDLLTARLVMYLTLFNDLWQPTAAYVTAELCPMTECSVVVDTTRRVLTVSMDPNPDFYIVADTVYSILLRGAYVISGLVPLNPTSAAMRVYTTAGILSWSGPATVGEASIRQGTVGQFFATIQGDLFTTSSDLRASLVRATTCSASVQGSDDQSFCSRLPYLLHQERISLEQDNRVAIITLQADLAFDASATDLVSLRLDGRATQSRVAPTNTFLLTVVPTAATFVLSGLPSDLSANDVAGGPTARPIRMRIALTGDRFVSNISRAVGELQSRGFSISGGPQAFSVYRGFSELSRAIIRPEAAVLTDDDRTLTISWVPNSAYLTDLDEVVTVVVPGSALVSGLNATSEQALLATFRIASTAAIITISPDTILASALRAPLAEIVLTIASGGTWEQSYVQVGRNILSSVMCEQALIAEPFGCSRFRSALFADVTAQGALINGSALVVQLSAVPAYDILAPETIVFELNANWTTAFLPVVPARLSVTIVPDPVVVYVVASMQLRAASSIHQAAGLVDDAVVERWTPATVVNPRDFFAAVGAWLNVPSSILELVSNVPEARVGNASARHVATIGFRIRNVRSSSPYYDNELSVIFTGMAPALPLTSHQTPALHWVSSIAAAPAPYRIVDQYVQFAYLSSVEPPSFVWEYLRSGTLPDNSEFVFPLSPLAVFGIAAGGVSLLLLAIGVRRGMIRARTQGGLGRATTKQEGAATTMDDQQQRAKEQLEEDAAVFAGQRGVEHTLRSGVAEAAGSKQWRGDPRSAFGAMNEETIERDIPILLYAGQGSVQAPRSEPDPLDVSAFLTHHGYMRGGAGEATSSSAPQLRGHRVTAEEARIQRAAVAAGLSNTAAKEGDLLRKPDPLEDPFAHVVYPTWSKSQPHAFHPPSKFREDMWNEL